MSSLLCEKRLGPLLAIVVLGVVSCGGKASSEARNLAAGGASGAPSSGGAAGAQAPSEPEPSIVHVTGNDADLDPQATPQCLAGFQGFSARVGGMSVDFEAFVFEPGDYEGDPLQILWLDALRNGEHYHAAAGTVESSGNISLHVVQVEPRFIGSLEAMLPAADDPMRAPLMLRLTFDIAVRAGCP